MADIAIDVALVERLVRAQHPDLVGPVAPVANGWDNAIFRLGAELCVRLPRRRMAIALIGNEQRWLPTIAARVGVPVPSPVRVGVPSDDFPRPWTIGPWFDGRLAASVPPAQWGAVAAELARFLGELHTPAPPDAPRNPYRGVPLAARTPAVHERLASGTIPRADELRRLWDRLAALPAWAGPPLWLHGDLHPGNVLVRSDPRTGRTRLAAVIDFGDLTSGDPATDLVAGWLFFDADARAEFRAHVHRRGDLDPHAWDRARGWALNLGTAIAAHPEADPRLAAVGAHTLEQVLLES